jgi:hypothetical protein
MTAPELAAGRLAAACLIGMGLGLCYGFLRPFRHRFPSLGDGLFLLAAAAGWVFLNFYICRGDLRLGYTAALAVGAFFFECTAGMVLRPIFSSFWGIIFRPFRKIFQKTGKIIKKLFAYGKKSATIMWGKLCSRKKQKGGRHEKASLTAEKNPDQIPPQQHSDQNRGHVRYRHIYGSPSVHADRL